MGVRVWGLGLHCNVYVWVLGGCGLKCECIGMRIEVSENGNEYDSMCI